MKKLILSLIIALCGLTAFSQTRAVKGITIGDHRVSGTNIEVIDSATVVGTDLKLYVGPTQITPEIPVAQRENFGDALTAYNTPLATGNVTAATGITSGMLSGVIYYNGASAIDITANPQIAIPTTGRIIVIVGSSDTNTLKLDDGNGIQLAGGVSFTIGRFDTITLLYVSTLSTWVELYRSNN